MSQVDLLLVSLGSTAGLRAVDDELVESLRRAGATVEVVRAERPPQLRTFALVDLAWALAARRAALKGIQAHSPRQIIYSTTTAALFWPRPGAIRFDAPAVGNRPGRHGIWQRSLERRRVSQAPLLIPQSAGGLSELNGGYAAAVTVPVAIEPSGELDGRRDIAAITYAGDPVKKDLERILAAWSQARRGDEELVVAGLREPLEHKGVPSVGLLPRDQYRALLRRARVFICAPRREDYGVTQLEALADGCQLVTTEAPGPYVALPIAQQLDARLVGDDIAGAVRQALDSPSPDYRERTAELLRPFTHDAVDRVVTDELLPQLLHFV